MFRVDLVSKSFGDHLVLSSVSFEVEAGKVFGLTGINGSGKSTLLRIISDVYRADAGTIKFDGFDAFSDPVRFKERIFFLNDNPTFPRSWKAKDVCDYYSAFYKNFSSEEFYSCLSNFGLNISDRINNFSKGQRRQLFVASALASKVKLILLDEAFDGLDPLSRYKCLQLIREKVKKENTSFIISSHSLRELEDIADSFGIINNGILTTQENVRSANVYHKYQVVIQREISPEELEGLSIFNIKRQGSVIVFIVKGDKQEIDNKFTALNPILFEEIPVSFEDLFLLEVEKENQK